MQGCVRRCTKLHNPNWILGCIFEKIFRSVHPALVYSTKVFETKTKENRNNKERIHRFQSKVQHIWWFLCTSTIMQNTLELVKQICPRLLVSPSFPDLVIHGATPTGIGLQLLRELSRSVCQILPGAPRDLWEVCHAGVLSRCPTATYGIGTKQGKSWDTHLLFPQNFPHVFQCFFQMFKVSHVFHHLFPSFSPFLSSMFSLPPWNSPFQARRSRGETSPAQRWFHGCVSGYTTRSRECCVLRKDPKGPKSVMWHILNHWTWLVT